MLVLTSSLADPDWPDTMDRETGVFTYYGDNKKPGRELHDTGRDGNLICKKYSRPLVRELTGDARYRRRSSLRVRAPGET